MEATRIKGLHHIELRTAEGTVEKIALEIRFKPITVQPPIGKQKRYPALDLTVIHATERGAPKGRKAIEWKLIRDMPVRTKAAAIEKIDWYAMRWKVEMFHKVLKPGCRAEASKASHRGSAGEFDGGVLHSKLAGALAYHVEANHAQCVGAASRASQISSLEPKSERANLRVIEKFAGGLLFFGRPRLCAPTPAFKQRGLPRLPTNSFKPEPRLNRSRQFP